METDAGGEIILTADDVTTTTPSTTTPISKFTVAVSRKYQHLLDKSTPLIVHRWIALSIIALAYIVRAYFLQGFYIVTYGLGLYILNLLIAFLSPKVDPEIQDLDDNGTDGPMLPIRGTDEYRPFVRRLPEFHFWYSLTKAFYIAFIMTFFSIFDVPVFWPILLFYFVMLFTLTMKKQILHMIKYKYVPFSVGKQRYDGKRTLSSDSLNLPSD